MSKYTGQYTPAEAASYATSVLLKMVTEYTRVDMSEMEKDPTELMELAKKSEWYLKYRGGPPREIGESRESDASTRATRGSTVGVRRRRRRRHSAIRREKERTLDGASRHGTGAISCASLAYASGAETISYASLGVRTETKTEGGNDGALFTISEEPEEEEWHIQFDGVGATRPGSGESQKAPKRLVGDPDHEPPQRTMAEEQEDRRRHRQEQERWNHIWMKRAREKDWYQVKTPLEAYRHSGFKGEIASDPRRTAEYVESVVQ